MWYPILKGRGWSPGSALNSRFLLMCTPEGSRWLIPACYIFVYFCNCNLSVLVWFQVHFLHTSDSLLVFYTFWKSFQLNKWQYSENTSVYRWVLFHQWVKKTRIVLGEHYTLCLETKNADHKISSSYHLLITYMSLKSWWQSCKLDIIPSVWEN